MLNKKELILVLAVTSLAILAWIGFNIFYTPPNIPLNPKLQEMLEPLNPNLDTSFLQQNK